MAKKKKQPDPPEQSAPSLAQTLADLANRLGASADDPEPKKPGRKPPERTREEMELEREEIIDSIHRLLVMRRTKSEIKKAINQKWVVAPRTYENLARIAKDRIALALAETRRNHRAMSLATYEQVITDPRSSSFDRIQAQRSIDDLLGLKVVKKDLPPLEVLRDLLGEMNQTIPGSDANADAAEVSTDPGAAAGPDGPVPGASPSASGGATGEATPARPGPD